MADKILREFARPVEIGGQEIHITTSIGIAHYPNDATDVNHLLKHADSAMYQAKDSGRNTVRFFTSDLNYLLSRRLEVEGRLRKGIEQEEFFLRYQPQVDLASGRIIGMEALLRWNDPVRGEMFPKDFISVAEDLGLIVPDGRVGVPHRLRPAQGLGGRGHQGRGGRGEPLAAPVHVAQARAHAAGGSSARAGVDPKRVEVEITETMVMRNLEQSIEILAQLRAVGIGVSIDDFGVGYSSLGQLRRLPATGLKIDRSFIIERARRRLERLHHRGDHRDGEAPQAARGGRGRGDAPAARVPARLPVRLLPGLPLLAAPDRPRGDRRCSGRRRAARTGAPRPRTDSQGTCARRVRASGGFCAR